MSHKINLDYNGSQLTSKPAAYLKNSFDDYRCAVSMLKWDKSANANVGALNLLPQVRSSLEAAGFVVEASPRLVDAYLAAHEARQQALTAASSRVAERFGWLYPYQREGVQWLAGRDRALLADEMGLGKTCQVLAALPENAPVVVVAPAAVIGVWVREIAKFRSDYKVVNILPQDNEILIVSYAKIPDLKLNPGTVLVADEAHYLKSAKSQRNRKFRSLARHAAKVWLVTATPLLNKPTDMWHILNTAELAEPTFGSWAQFARLMGGRQGRFAMEWTGRVDSSVPNLLTRSQLRRRKVDVLTDLPPKCYSDIRFNLPKKITTEIYASVLGVGDGSQLTRTQIAAAQTRIANLTHVDFEGLSEARKLLATAKIEVMLEQVEIFEENETPLVVFSAHVDPISQLSGRDGWRTITGVTSAEERTQIVADFQDGKLKGVAGTIGAMGVGLTLTRASNVLFVDLDWTPALNSQAEDRCHRIGQEDRVQILRILSDHPLDARILDILSSKHLLLEAVDGSIAA